MQKMIACDNFVEFELQLKSALQVPNTEVIMIGSQVKTETKVNANRTIYDYHWYAIIERN